MAIGHKDFSPTVTHEGFFSTDYESLESLMSRVNAWIAGANVQVLNIETLLLPNLTKVDSSTTVLRTSGDTSSHWYQTIRIWYETSPASEAVQPDVNA